MNQTTYRPRPQYRPAPKPQQPPQAIKTALYAPKEGNSAVRDEIKRVVGRHSLTVVVEEDVQTLGTLNVAGLVAFIATLLKGDKVIAQGRGSAVLNQANRFVGRTIGCAFNAAVADAAIRSTKVLDLVREKSETEATEALRDAENEPASDKQREYLRQLIRVNVYDESERESWEQRLPEFSKAEASRAIEQFKR